MPNEHEALVEAVAAAAKVADERAHECARIMALPGLRHDDRMIWEQRKIEARGIARAIRNLARSQG